jgi:anti-anti-sigma regulatory factor
LTTPNLSRFCRTLREASRSGVALVLVGGPPHVRRVVELCAIDGVELQRSEDDCS